MNISQKLQILADAAKYDASCASSGTTTRDSRQGGVGSTSPGMGICHSYAPDGRCISLLKILMTNFCLYDCQYCINRISSDVRRARLTPEEIVQLTLDFYRRNYIEGLFLSSGIIRNPDYTMEMVVRVARILRTDHQFNGYIHLKTIPEASSELIAEAGRWADRISINIELPVQEDLNRLAPEKNIQRIEQTMGEIRQKISASQEERQKSKKAPLFAPGGQSTQMIVGATPSSDQTILHRASSLYRNQKLKRVYYSAYSPIASTSPHLPPIAPPLVREHRLYQADWLLRFYGFKVEEITNDRHPDLSLEVDPKLAWALRNPGQFPICLQTAPKELLLRVPGIGVQNVIRILQVRRWQKIRVLDLVRLRLSLKKVLPFVIVADHRPRRIGEISWKQTLVKPTQLEFLI